MKNGQFKERLSTVESTIEFSIAVSIQRPAGPMANSCVVLRRTVAFLEYLPCGAQKANTTEVGKV